MINIKNINVVILNSSKARLKKEDNKMNKKYLVSTEVFSTVEENVKTYNIITILRREVREY